MAQTEGRRGWVDRDKLHPGYLRDRMTDWLLSPFSEETAEHLINVKKEGLMAVRSMIDGALRRSDLDIERLRAERKGPPHP